MTGATLQPPILGLGDKWLLAPYVLLTVGALVLMWLGTGQKTRLRDVGLAAAVLGGVLFLLLGGAGLALTLLVVATISIFSWAGLAVTLAATTLFASMILLLQQWDADFTRLKVLTLDGDRLTLLMGLFLGTAALLTCWLLRGRQRRDRVPVETYALILFSVAGGWMLLQGRDLITLFLGFEILSLPIYVAVGLGRGARGREAALKYFLIGAFAAAFILYGMAVLYGATGSLDLGEMSALIRDQGLGSAAPTLLVGLGLLTVGFLFKMTLFPFHFWAPDVYEGAPTPVTAYLAVGSKGVAFATLGILWLRLLPVSMEQARMAVAVLAVLTMTGANLCALVQPSLKRMLAYSSIAHAGYLALALLTERPLAVLGFYLWAYLFMNFGAFGVICVLEREDGRYLHIQDYAGLAGRRPGLAGLLALAMLALAGLPLTAGFAAKFFLFREVLLAHGVTLALIGLLNSFVSMYYYLRVIVTCYMRPPIFDEPLPETPLSIQVVLGVSLAGTILLGVLPEFALDLVQQVAASLR